MTFSKETWNEKIEYNDFMITLKEGSLKGLNQPISCGGNLKVPKPTLSAVWAKLTRRNLRAKLKNMNRLLKRPILNVIENHAISYPTPANISYM
jgi:hypothetical protein